MLYYNKFSDIPESYKERNFYFKIFGGCIFNELVNNHNVLINNFFNKLIYKYKESCNSYFNIELKNQVIELLSNMATDANQSKVHIDFDHHIIQSTNGVDRGELADILINTDSGFLAIEAKLNSNWNYKKDIKSNRKCIDKVSNLIDKRGVQVLLIRKSKWEGNKLHENRKESNYKKLKKYLQGNGYDISFILLFWENILDIIEPYAEFDKIRAYMRNML